MGKYGEETRMEERRVQDIAAALSRNCFAIYYKNLQLGEEQRIVLSGKHFTAEALHAGLSAEFCQIAERAQPEYRGRLCELASPEYLQTIADGGTDHLEYIYASQTDQEEVIWTRMIITLLCGEARTIEAIVYGLIDMTPWKNAEIEARRKAQQYQRKLVQSAREIRASYLREAKLRAAAETDQLTRMKNEAAFQKEMTGCIREIREGESGILLMLDGDGFKNINDTYGHAAGDEIIQMLADVIRKRVRFYDIAARLHGDEFAIYLQSPCSREAAQQVVLDINEMLRAEAQRSGKPVVSVSAGMAVVHAGDYYDELYKEADVALYRVKAEKRNGNNQ